MTRQRPRKRSAPAPATQPALPRHWFALLLIVIAAGAAYANSLHGPFLLDDQRAIVENQSIRRLWPLTAALDPPRQTPVTGRPLANLSFAVSYAVGGFRVESFHALNIAIHVLAALALFGVLRRTFARTPAIVEEETASWLALACALVWSVHPLNSEAVNYLTQRTELMMGLFVLVTLYAAIRALETRAARWIWVAAAAAFCAVGSKETALTLPLLVILWDRAFAFPSLRAAWAGRRWLYGALASSWLLFAYFARGLPFFVERGFEVSVPRTTYLLHQAAMVLQYLSLSAWPRGLVFDYGAVQPITIGAVWPGVVAVAVLIAASLAALVRVPAAGYWAAWFWITLAPPSSLIPIPTEVGAERRMYLPLVGVIVLAGLGAHVLLRRLGSPAMRKIAAVAAGAVVIVLAGVTIRRNVDYRSGLAIWQDVLNRRPHARAYEHLSIHLRDAGRTDESIAHLRTAAVESPRARLALASALLERGDLDDSIAQFRQFVTANPASREIVRAREEFVVALSRAGDLDGAIEQLRAITAAAPDYARGRVMLAETLTQRKDLEGAVREYREVLHLQPGNVVALAGLGGLLALRGERTEALAVLRRALELEPRALPPRRFIVRLLGEEGKYADMEKEAALLVTYAPTDPEAHNLLGIALASQGRFAPASERFAEALRLDPSHDEARANRARVDAFLARERR